MRGARPPRLYAVRVDILERATRYAYPVVSHTFYGRTPQEAWGYHESHRKSDAFLRQCEDKQRFGDVECVAEITEGWTT